MLKIIKLHFDNAIEAASVRGQIASRAVPATCSFPKGGAVVRIGMTEDLEGAQFFIKELKAAFKSAAKDCQK